MTEDFEKRLQLMMESQYTTSSDMFMDLEALDEKKLSKRPIQRIAI